MKKIVDSTLFPKNEAIQEPEVIETKPLNIPKPDKKPSNTALIVFIVVVVVVVVTVIVIRYRNKKKAENISTENNASI